MKNTFILFLLLIFCFNINAQDTITLKNRKVINAYIIEKSDTKIKYRTESPDNTDSTYSVKLSKIKTIHYGNGEVDLLSSRNPRSIYPLGINSGFMVMNFYPILLGSIDYFITPNISAEINFKYIPSNSIRNVFSIGGKYWLSKKYGKSGFSPFAGLFFTQWSERNDYEDITWYGKPEWSAYNYLEVPIGISYITKFGLQTSLQLDNYFLYNSNELYIVSGIIELRIGWRFR